MEHKAPRGGSKNNSSVKIFHQQSKINLPEFLVKNSKHIDRLKFQTMGTKTRKRNLKDHLLNTENIEGVISSVSQSSFVSTVLKWHALCERTGHYLGDDVYARIHSYSSLIS